MRASVDVSNLVVICDGSSSPFHFDLDHGSASIELDSGVYEVRPLTWRAKMRLARFAPLREVFVQARFLEACIGRPAISVGGERNEAVLLALATWINRPSDETYELPLDQGKLAGLTTQLCRSLGVGPMAFAELTAPEVELLWQSLDHSEAQDEVANISAPAETRRVTAPRPLIEQEFDTRIVIVPDEVEVPCEAKPCDIASENVLSQALPPISLVQSESEPLATEPAPAKSYDANRPVFSTQNPSPRFRVSLNTPLTRTTTRQNTFSRTPIGQTRQVSPSPARPENSVTRVLTQVEPEDRAEGFVNIELSPNFETPAPQAPASRIQPELSVITPAEEIEFMLDVFCERLAEAAADLGIMEEV